MIKSLNNDLTHLVADYGKDVKPERKKDSRKENRSQITVEEKPEKPQKTVAFDEDGPKRAEEKLREDMDAALEELALVQINPSANDALKMSKDMSIKDIESLIKGGQKPLIPKATLPNGLKQRKTMAKTDQHDFNYKIQKDGSVKNDPYGTANRQLKQKIEKIDH